MKIETKSYNELLREVEELIRDEHNNGSFENSDELNEHINYILDEYNYGTYKDYLFYAFTWKNGLDNYDCIDEVFDEIVEDINDAVSDVFCELEER